MKAFSVLICAFCYAAVANAQMEPSYYDSVVKSHAILGASAMVFFFPVGAIILRVSSGPKSIWLHAGFQMFALAMLTANVGMGIWMTSSLNYYHQIIGLIVFGLAWFQPIGGFLHHFLFAKYDRRTIVSHLHIRLGAIVITLGIINGGLGLMIADDSTFSERVAYSVIGGFFWLLYLFVTVIAEHRRDARRAASEKSGFGSD